MMRHFLVVLAAGLAACGDPPNPSGPVEDYPLEEWPETQLEMGEELGRIQGPEIHRVLDVLIDEDGSAVLIQAGDHSLRFYGPDGAPRDRLGREGQGPGEFMGIGAVGRMADSLWVYDPRERRYSVFTPEGDFARVARRPQGHTLEHVYPGDTLLVSYGDHDRYPESRIFATATAEGSVIEELARHQMDAYRVRFAAGGIEGLEYAPMAPRPRSAVSADGSRLAIVQSIVAGPAAGSFVVTAVAPLDGDTLFARRYRADLQRIASDEMEAELASIDRMWPGAGVVAKLREQGLPEFYPPIERVTVGHDGTVWILMRPTDDGWPYRVLGAGGEPLGTLLVPEGHRILEAGQDEVWIVERDELDVESVARYRVR